MKIGLGITTYQRFDRFKECFENVLKNSRDLSEIIVVEDCSTKDKEKYDEYFNNIIFNNIIIIRNEQNKGVGYSKNCIMKYFYEHDYDYFFTLEDDINIKTPDVFLKYIECSIKTNYDYINFAMHGTHNPVCTYKIKNHYTYKVYPNIVGAFTLYTPRLIKEIGYHDEEFFNAMEHVEYTYRASLKGLTTPFWEFIDIVANADCLVEQAEAIVDSSIRPRDDWKSNIQKAYKHFYEKHKVNLFDVPRPA